MMNEMPKPQKLLIYLSWAFAGLMGLGGVIGVINDTLDLVTLPVSLVGTSLIVIFYFGAQQYLKHYGWQTEYGRITRLNFGMILPLVGMVALLWLPQLVQLVPGSRAFPRAAADEALIVVATFHRTEGVVDSAVHDEIRRAIQEKIEDLNLEKVRVAVEPTIVPSANRYQAEALGKRYNGTVIIWGTDSGVRLEINFLNLKEPDFAAAEATISETLRTQLANPDAYSQFVINELPGQLTYLSFFALAQTEYGQENYKEAILLLETAIDSLSNLTETHSALLDLDAAYFRLGWLYQITDQLPPAIVAYDQAIAFNMAVDTAFINRGVIYYSQGKYDMAIANYDQALTINPERAEVFSNRGLAYAAQKEYERAIVDYGRAITLNPELAIAFNNRGLAYVNQGDYELAIADYDHAIALNLDLAPKVYTNRGLAYAKQQDYGRAIADYDQAITLYPEYAVAFYNRGNAYAEQGDYDRAIADYTEAITLNPEYAAAFSNRGLAYAEQQKYEHAVVDYDQAIALDPKGAAAFINRGNVYADQGKFERAILDYDQATVLNPESVEAFNNRGTAYAELGEYTRAIADYNQAIALNPKYANAYIVRSYSLLELEQYVEALSDLRTYLELDPQSPWRKGVEDLIHQLEVKLEN
jgi:tetratricopeptide (TPR) repeat protein